MVRDSICWRVPQVLSDTAVVLTKLGRLCELVLRLAETDCPLDSVHAGTASLVSGRRCVHLEARAGAMAKSALFISSVAAFSVNAAYYGFGARPGWKKPDSRSAQRRQGGSADYFLLSGQSEKVTLEQSRNVLLTGFRLEECRKDSYR
jgi:hypothetical protein